MDHLSYDGLVKLTGGAPSPMSCRAFLAPHETPYEGRNNLCVCSINPVRCALKAKGDKAIFWSELERVVGLAKEVLSLRLEVCRKIQAKVAPILYLEGAFGLRAESPEEYVFDRFFANNRASISLGYIGLYEVCVAMFGKGPHEDAEAHDFAISVVKYLHDKCEQWKQEESIGYTLYSTPSEGLAHKFTDKDRALFGIIPNITDKEYYQNSYHTDVRFKMHPMEKTLVESDYQQYSRGGFIVYNELPILTHNLEAMEGIIDFGIKHTPYFATNTGVDSCYECNFKGEIKVENYKFTCPQCGNTDYSRMNVIRRVSGYIGNPNNRPMPLGKWAEVLKRVKNTM